MALFFTKVQKREKNSRKLKENSLKIELKKKKELKRKVCGDSDKGFVVINQKEIDLFSLDALSKEGIGGRSKMAE